MIQYYLVPAVHFTGDTGKPEIRPKYCDELQLNWVGTYVPDIDKYVIQTNSKFASKHSSIAANADVVVMDGTRATKDKLQSDLKIKKIKDTEDEFEVIGQISEPTFKKNKLYVESD